MSKIIFGIVFFIFCIVTLVCIIALFTIWKNFFVDIYRKEFKKYKKEKK